MEKNLLSSFVSPMDESFVHEASIFTQDDLSSYWEFINSSETHSDDDVISLDDGFGSSRSSMSSSSAPKSGCQVVGDSDADQVGADVKEHGDLRNREAEENVEDGVYDGGDHCYSGCQEMRDFNGDRVGADVKHGDLRYLEEEENVEDDVYDGDDGDLDDELVPWSVSGKFGRQRMRKLGKRSFSKMNQTKRSRYAYVKPGCVRGKHGLGLKHSV